MKDFQIVSAKIILPVTSIAPIRGFLPIAIVVLGQDFDQATEVHYNGVTVNEFIIQSKTRMIVRVPDSQIGKAFQTLEVVSSTFATKKDALLYLGLERPVRTTSGLERLIQMWTMVFLTTPGSDIFDPQSGGGAQAIIGRTTDKNGKGVAADLAYSIDRTKTELLRLQSKNPNLPLEEKILSSSLASLSFDDKTTTLYARVTLRNMLGQSAEVSFKG